MPTKKSVIIIGAGLSGLAAAYELAKTKQFDITVLEAEAEVGGRVKSIEVEHKKVDVGGFIVYPWYTNYHRLARELGIADKLQKIKSLQLYYQLDKNGAYFSASHVPIPFTEKVQLGGKLLRAWLRAWPNFRAPDLGNFKGKTAAEFIAATPGTVSALGRYMDSVSQGYCYAPLTENRMTFFAPFIYQAAVHGDVQTGAYFGGDSQLLPRTLATEIERLGGKILTHTTVESIAEHTVNTNGGDFSADYIVFANQVSPVYKKIITAPPFSYTHFYALVVKCDKAPLVNDNPAWSAVFYAVDNTRKRQIVSSIRAQEMVPELSAKYVILNYKVETTEAIDAAGLQQDIERDMKELFLGITTAEIITAVHWPAAMPITREQFVAEVRKRQGMHGYYFAGDYLGAPSMETAISSGVAVARDIFLV